MTQTSEAIDELRERFVRPIYLQLLNANFTRPTGWRAGDHQEADAALHAQITACARQIADDEIRMLLADGEWRGRLVAGWLAGLSRREALVPSIAGLLIASEQPYAGQGFCVALGLIGNEECRGHLRAYLTKYLPPDGRFYDQHWAIGALAHVEHAEPKEFLLPELWAGAQPHMNPSEGIQKFSKLVDYLDQHQMRATI